MNSEPTPDDGTDSADPFPDLLHTTIRVERVGGDQFRATQRGSEYRGLGSTPHQAIADYAEIVEAACVDTPDPL